MDSWSLNDGTASRLAARLRTLGFPEANVKNVRADHKNALWKLYQALIDWDPALDRSPDHQP